MIPTIVTRSLLVERCGTLLGRASPSLLWTRRWMSSEEAAASQPTPPTPPRDGGKKGKKKAEKPESQPGKRLELMPIPKPVFGKKALMNLRKKTGFSMSECRKALLKHEMNFEAAETFLKNEAVKDEEEQVLAEERDSLPGEAAVKAGEGHVFIEGETPGKKQEVQKKKKKKKLKGGVVVARLSKDAAMLLEMNCQSVTLTQTQEFHNLVDSVANLVFENVQSLVWDRKAGVVVDIRVEDVEGSIKRSSLNTNDILSLKKISNSSEDNNDGTDKRTRLTVKRIVAEGKAKLGEALSPKRCVIFASCQDSDAVRDDISPSPSPSTVAPPPPRRPRFHFGFYVHPSSVRDGITQRPLNGRYGALVAFAKISDAINEKHFDLRDVGRKLSQHVVGMNPKSIVGEQRRDRSSIEIETRSNEQTEEEEEKRHLSEFGTETRLLEQEFLLDSTFLVKEYLFINGVRVVDFARFECVGR